MITYFYKNIKFVFIKPYYLIKAVVKNGSLQCKVGGELITYRKIKNKEYAKLQNL